VLPAYSASFCGLRYLVPLHLSVALHFRYESGRGGTDTGGSGRGEEEVSPRLRVLCASPFVRLLTGLNHDELGTVYSEIWTWHTRLKTANEDIRITQEERYQAIVDGVHVKWWLLTGQGLRLLPGIQLIEGRAKEDVRLYILQA
jgi:hypothetical protein